MFLPHPLCETETGHCLALHQQHEISLISLMSRPIYKRSVSVSRYVVQQDYTMLNKQPPLQILLMLKPVLRYHEPVDDIRCCVHDFLTVISYTGILSHLRYQHYHCKQTGQSEFKSFSKCNLISFSTLNALFIHPSFLPPLFFKFPIHFSASLFCSLPLPSPFFFFFFYFSTAVYPSSPLLTSLSCLPLFTCPRLACYINVHPITVSSRHHHIIPA